MLEAAMKDIANTIRESIEAGLKDLSSKFDTRIAEVEKSLQLVVKSPDQQEIKSIVDRIVEEAIKAVPVPKDGKDATIDYDKLKNIIDEELSKAVKSLDIKLPQDGKDGKDALDIEILPEIDLEKSYPRGVYAQHKGGLWRTYQTTKALRGWECIVEGMANVAVEYDGARKAFIKVERSSGEIEQREISIPAILHKGVWKQQAYEQGDCVQLSGSMWICAEPTEERPGEGSKAWQVAAKRGGTGDSAFDIARKAGFVGDKQAWLDSLGKKTTVKV